MQTHLSTALAIPLCFLLSAAAAAAPPTPGYNPSIPAEIMTPEKVETRIGTLKFFDGLPDEATVKAVYDNLDFARGMEAFLQFVPAASLEALREGAAKLGSQYPYQVVIMDQLLDSNPLFLTGNTDTVYASTIFDLERDGRVMLRYCDDEGAVSDAANPNGSVANVAGVRNARGNVMGLMPHPEHAVEAAIGGTDGAVVLGSLLDAVREGWSA